MYDNINSPAYQLQWCMLLSQLLSVYRSRAAKWIGYYWLFPDIIGYFPKLINFWMAKCMETIAHSVEVQKYGNSIIESRSTYIIRGNTYWQLVL